MNNLVKAGEVMKLKDLIQYEDGSISNLDVASNPSMKFVLMAFDAATTGRLSLAEYKTLDTARYLDNIRKWHEKERQLSDTRARIM